MDSSELLKGLAYNNAEQTMSNINNYAFNTAYQKQAFKQTQKINEMNLQNLTKIPALTAQGFAQAGFNPYLVGDSHNSVSTSQAAVGQANGSPMGDYANMRMLGLQMENMKNSNEISKQTARKTKAEADIAELEALRNSNYDDFIARYFGTFFPNFGNDPNEPLTKGSLDAIFDMSQKGSEFTSHKVTKLENEWKTFYNKKLLESPELQKKFIDSVKAEFEKKINENEDIKNKLKLQAIEIDMKEVEKHLQKIDLATLERSNLDAFIAKEGKTWEDYAMFFGTVIFMALANNLH